MNFVASLSTSFIKNSDLENAIPMAKYMRNHFSFYGIKTKKRRTLLDLIYKEHELEITENAREIALLLYGKQQREFHYCAIEILIKQLTGNYKKEDIKLIEKLILTNSWWDSVDTIAKFILGNYLLEYPDETFKIIEKFSNSDDMWLNRSVLLFQLGYKSKTNFDILKSECNKHKVAKEFFIQKAIGWGLREYSKTNPEKVKNYVNEAKLMPLSQKEALKNFF